jgi:pyruvate dehydrogenase E2 component (dihydrolipoamide acetyltransferase)
MKRTISRSEELHLACDGQDITMTETKPQSDERTVPLSWIQTVIGRRMSWSKQNIPCFYLQRKADIGELLDMRREAGRERAVKVTTNDLLMKALGLAVEKFPLMAGRRYGDDIVIAETVNVGFGVAAPHGLVVPVVRDAQKKSVFQIAAESESLTQRARSNQLKVDDVGGACITLSNLGAFGIDSFIAVTSPKQASVLAVGNIMKSMVRKDGIEAIHRKMDLTLSVDHTMINGDYAAGFLSFVAELLEQPQRLLEEK